MPMRVPGTQLELSTVFVVGADAGELGDLFAAQPGDPAVPVALGQADRENFLPG
ncbi:hypothetical protein [Streptomyces sp. NPDC051001]|uniref:hypothetical protein n=1 Tax=Streptomyces sp. NPDC051001 TaxID=3155795 RepID=UPI00342D9438